MLRMEPITAAAALTRPRDGRTVQIFHREPVADVQFQISA